MTRHNFCHKVFLFLAVNEKLNSIYHLVQCFVLTQCPKWLLKNTSPSLLEFHLKLRSIIHCDNFPSIPWFLTFVVSRMFFIPHSSKLFASYLWSETLLVLLSSDHYHRMCGACCQMGVASMGQLSNWSRIQLTRYSWSHLCMEPNKIYHDSHSACWIHQSPAK